MFRAVLALLLALPAVALAVPSTVSHQGRLFDSLGSPLSSTHTVGFTLYTSATAGSSVWTESQPIEFDNGYFAATLGAATPIGDSVLEADSLWLALSVDGGAELPGRIKLNSVPYALSARGVDGGVVNASRIEVNGTTVVDATGAIQGSVDWSKLTNVPQMSDTLASLGCGAGQLIRYSGSAWQCVAESDLSIAGTQISSPVPVAQLPVGTSASHVAAGDASYLKTESYSRAEVDAKVVGAGRGLEVSGGAMHISEYAYGPLMPNARFESGNFSGWTQDTGAGAVIAVSDGQAGGYVHRNDPFAVSWISNNARIPIRPMQDYKVSGSFRRTETVGNTGTFYLAVRLFDSSGANIGGDGTWWYYPISGAQLTDTNWHTYAIEFGPNFGRAFPANARTMTVGAILNYNGGNRNYQVTNLQLTVTDPPTSRPVMAAFYPTAHQTGCAANTYCTLPLNGVQYNTSPGAFTLSSDGNTVTVNVAGYYMLDAHALVYQNSASSVTHFEVYKNGNRVQLSHHEYNAAVGWARHDIHRPEYFAAGDQITAKVYQNVAQHVSHQAHQGPDYTRLSLTLLR